MAAVYTTTAEVRNATGMKDRTNINDDYILNKIEMAQGVIDGIVGDVYSVPFSAGSVPDLIQAIALNMATAWLYMETYGKEVEGTALDGKALMDDMLDKLKMIQKQVIKLRNSSGAELTRTALLKPTSYPTQTTTDNETTKRQFTSDKKF